MKSSEFIKKIRHYSVISFLLPLLAINSCLVLYKILGNIDKYPSYNWNKKIIEIRFSENINKPFSFLDCPKYKYNQYLVTAENDLILSITENDVSINQDKVNELIKNNKIKSERYEFHI